MTRSRTELTNIVPTLIKRELNWGDQDPYSHVNNSVFFSWMEASWATFLYELGMPELISQGGNLNFILISIECQFKQQIKFPDSIFITCEIDNIQRSFLTFHHQVWSTSKKSLCATGASKVVLYDRCNNRVVKIDLKLKTRLYEFQKNGKNDIAFNIDTIGEL
jgi:acyl-CoA thioester hydrolase